jgi:hypothetical protein
MMDNFFYKLLKILTLIALQVFTTKIFTTKKGMGNKFERKKSRKNSVARDEKNIAPIIKFIGSYRLPFEKV